jgi:hypothetical protein
MAMSLSWAHRADVFHQFSKLHTRLHVPEIKELAAFIMSTLPVS